MFRDRVRAVAKNPEKGKQRGDIKPGYYSLQAGKHHIYYRIRDSQIEVIDVLHQSMEPKMHIG